MHRTCHEDFRNASAVPILQQVLISKPARGKTQSIGIAERNWKPAIPAESAILGETVDCHPIVRYGDIYPGYWLTIVSIKMRMCTTLADYLSAVSVMPELHVSL